MTTQTTQLFLALFLGLFLLGGACPEPETCESYYSTTTEVAADDRDFCLNEGEKTEGNCCVADGQCQSERCCPWGQDCGGFESCECY